VGTYIYPFGYLSSSYLLANKALLCAGPATIFGSTVLCGVVSVRNATIAANSSGGAMVVCGDMGVSGNAFISNQTVERDFRVMGNTTLDGSLKLGGSLVVSGKYSFDLMKVEGDVAATSLTTGTLLVPGAARVWAETSMSARTWWCTETARSPEIWASRGT
jgi:hypothetical protein